MQVLASGGVGAPGIVGRHLCLCLVYRFLAVVVKQLRHCCGHASRYRASLAEVIRTGQVVWRPLAPGTRHERLYARVCGNLGSLGCFPALEGRNLTGIVVQPLLHVGRQLAVVEVALVGIAQNIVRLVVARNDDIAVVGTAVEHVVALCLVCGSQSCSIGYCLQVALSRCFLQELCSFLLGLFSCNRVCMHAKHGHDAQQDSDDCSLFHSKGKLLVFYVYTTFCGLPQRNALTLSVATCSRRFRASSLAQAI